MSKEIGITEWFSFEDYERVEKAVELLTELGVKDIRTLVSWADWERPGGRKWYDWLFKKLGQEAQLHIMPALFYTPHHLAMPDHEGKIRTSHPPRDPHLYALFIKDIIEKYGAHFEWVQLWNEPNWKVYWNDDLDPDWNIFISMAKEAGDMAHSFGKKTVLGGITPLELQWIAYVIEQGIETSIDAVAFHYSPSWPNQHRRWFPIETEINALRAMINGYNVNLEIWLGEIGFSTNTESKDEQRILEREQINYFEKIRYTDADKIFWYSLFDQKPDTSTDDMLNTDKEADLTAYHFGIVRCDYSKKPLFDYWNNITKKV